MSILIEVAKLWFPTLIALTPIFLFIIIISFREWLKRRTNEHD